MNFQITQNVVCSRSCYVKIFKFWLLSLVPRLGCCPRFPRFRCCPGVLRSGCCPRVPRSCCCLRVPVARSCPWVVRSCPWVVRSCPWVVRSCPWVIRSCHWIVRSCPRVPGSGSGGWSIGWCQGVLHIPLTKWGNVNLLCSEKEISWENKNIKCSSRPFSCSKFWCTWHILPDEKGSSRIVFLWTKTFLGVPVCDGTQNFKRYRYRYLSPAPNIFDTDTGTFFGTNFFRYRFRDFFGTKFFRYRFRYHQKKFSIPGTGT